jgi:hypothetical protein
MTDKFEERLDKLFKLGLKYDGSSMIYHDINFHTTDITCMTDEQFEKALKGATERKKAIDEN